MNKFIHTDSIKYMKEIKEESIDMIFTDPPYKLISGGMSTKNKNTKQWSKNCKSDYSTKDGIIYKVPKPSEYIHLLYKILKNDSYCFVMTNDRNIELFLTEARKVKFKLCSILIIHKPNKTPNPYFMKNIEFIIMFRKGKYKKIKSSYMGNGCIFKTNKIQNKIHISQKDVEFIKVLIKACTNEYDLICDPFAGSGSTGIACIECNRYYLMFEENEESYNKANLRIKELKKKL